MEFPLTKVEIKFEEYLQDCKLSWTETGFTVSFETSSLSLNWPNKDTFTKISDLFSGLASWTGKNKSQPKSVPNGESKNREETKAHGYISALSLRLEAFKDCSLTIEASSGWLWQGKKETCLTIYFSALHYPVLQALFIEKGLASMVKRGIPSTLLHPWIRRFYTRESRIIWRLLVEAVQFLIVFGATMELLSGFYGGIRAVIGHYWLGLEDMEKGLPQLGWFALEYVWNTYAKFFSHPFWFQCFLLIVIPFSMPIIMFGTMVVYAGLALWLLSFLSVRGYVVAQMTHQVINWVWTHLQIDAILKLVKLVNRQVRDIWGWLLWAAGIGKKNLTPGGYEAVGVNESSQNQTTVETKKD